MNENFFSHPVTFSQLTSNLRIKGISINQKIERIESPQLGKLFIILMELSNTLY